MAAIMRRRLARCNRPSGAWTGARTNPAARDAAMASGAAGTAGSGGRELRAGHPRAALRRVLAGHAGGDLRDRPEACRRDALAALLAEPVVAGAQALERLREPVGPLHQQAPHRE